VRDLVNHVTAEVLWAPPLMAGATIEEVGDRLDGDVLGDDPLATWNAAVAELGATCAEPDVLRRTVHLSFGDTPAEEYVTQIAADVHLHGWDLATALGEDDRIDPDALRMMLDSLQAVAEQMREMGMFGPAVEVPPHADDQTRVLGLVGRKPGGGLRN
jgi:uncharacterized protein (TIGR03086 family)